MITDKPSNVEDGAEPKTPKPKLKFPTGARILKALGGAIAFIGYPTGLNRWTAR
jgi:hypothetical protein